jgi:hypothetical protein
MPRPGGAASAASNSSRRCLVGRCTRVCVNPGGDARAAGQLAAVEPAWVRKKPVALTVVRDANCAEIRRPIRRLPDQLRKVPTVLRPDRSGAELRCGSGNLEVNLT